MSRFGERTRIVNLAGSILILLLATACWAGDLEVVMLDVGQGDAILVTCPDGKHHLLIDSGDKRYPGSSKAFREQMQSRFPEGQRHLDLVVASHPHLDHIGSMQWVLENFDVETYVDNGHKYDSATFGKLNDLRRRLVKQGKLKYINGKKSSLEEVKFCPDVKVELIEAWAMRELDDPNDRSLGLHLQHAQVSFLFTGDMEKKAENVLLDELSQAEQERLLDVDVLKVGHHASHTSTSRPFLSVVSPKHALISAGAKDVGTNAGYRHPRSVTLDTLNDELRDEPENGRISAFDDEKDRWRQMTRRRGIWATPADGTITVRSNGQSVKVEVEDN